MILGLYDRDYIDLTNRTICIARNGVVTCDKNGKSWSYEHIKVVEMNEKEEEVLLNESCFDYCFVTFSNECCHNIEQQTEVACLDCSEGIPLGIPFSKEVTFNDDPIFYSCNILCKRIQITKSMFI